MEKKQTAVQWLEEQLYKTDWDKLNHDERMNICSTAKMMEQEQLIKAHGIKEKKSSGISNYVYKYSGEEYYNDTYKSE
jgi:hypothetical protein